MSEHRGTTIDAAPAVRVEPLGDGLWTASGGSYRTVFAEGRSSVVAFNTFGTPEAARAFRDAIERTAPGKPIRTLVATIDHLDHAGYGAELAPQAEVVAHELTAKVIAGRKARGQPCASRIVGGEGETLEVDDVRFSLVYPGPTQGTGNLAVHFEERRLLFLVGPQAGARYGLFPDFHVEQYASSMRRLFELDFDVLVPGRYDVMSRVEAERAVRYFESLATVSQQAFAAGVPIWVLDAMGDFARGALRDDWGDLDGFDDHVAVGALRLVHHYLMGGWGLEDTRAPEQMLESSRSERGR